VLAFEANEVHRGLRQERIQDVVFVPLECHSFIPPDEIELLAPLFKREISGRSPVVSRIRVWLRDTGSVCDLRRLRKTRAAVERCSKVARRSGDLPGCEEAEREEIAQSRDCDSSIAIDD